LGMMITKALVDLHRGHVSVRSDGLGLGSTFTLKIPLSSPPPIPELSAPELTPDGPPVTGRLSTTQPTSPETDAEGDEVYLYICIYI
jgi:hypothetical protein